MRATVKASIFLLGLASACGHGGAVPAAPPRGLDGHAAAGGSAGPAQYVVADPSARGNVVALALGGGASLGLVVDKTRIVIGRGEPHVGVDLPDQPIAGAARIPGRFGGGFLFWTDTAVYRSDAFDGPLKPIAKTPDSIQVISFAPKFLLVRTRNGERWALGIPSGERMPIDPLGAADVEGLDDGRALAFNDQGAAFSSTDHGAHWNDVTSQVKSSPARIAVVDDEIWLFESSGSGLRLEPDGQLSSFDKQPVEKPPEMRAQDPRWRGAEAPLRMAFHAGATIDENTAIVVEQGDIVRVDVHTGEIAGIVPGKLPPDAHCEAVPTANDVLFACVSRGAGPSGSGVPSAFVVSHTLSGDAPTVEQTFAGVAQFYGSDDGGLAFAAPCNASAAGTPDHTVCVRQPGGAWQDYDLSALTGDAGAGDVTVARWVPRADGRAVAVLVDPTPGIYDPRTGTLVAVEPSGRDVLGQGLAPSYARVRRRLGGGFSSVDGTSLVDWSWSFSATGSLRGWQRHGGIVEIADDGKVTRSPYSFDLVASGPFALGRTAEGRFYQSTDHGGTWVEVAAPPSGSASGDLRACSTAGCDLGGFYRVGWAVRPPRIETAPTAARPAPEVRRTRPIEIACRPAGPAQSRILARTANSPDDLGLGNNRLPVAGERNEIAFVRNTIARTIAHPLHEAPSGDSDTPSLRGMLSGFGTTNDGAVIEVAGPNKSPSALRRGLSFVPAFDPAAPVKRATLAMSEVLAVGRAAGMTNDEILSDDMTESGNVIMVTPHDASAASDLAFQNTRGLIALVHANERTKLAMRPSQNEGTIISGVGLGGDEAAFLELESSGVGHVFRIGGGGVTELFDVNPTANDTAFYPANPDSLAVGPRGDLAIIRVGSGSDPASAQDPALLLVPALPAVALAPWSTLRLADDPACKEPGWRTTLQVIAPWIRTSTPELRVEDLPMIARVKWSDKRVCLEGVEVKLPDVSVRAPGSSGADLLKVGSWLVSRGSTFARIAIADGVEWRQPLECTFATPKP
ncbi:MAG TPA: hypothetical protein VLT33_00670 [Labilithrix sp.]|nr:hypothetical protein [Labilithrix sp.]